MEKRTIESFDLRDKCLMPQSSMSRVYDLNDGSVLKVFRPDIILDLKGTMYDVEKKILDAKPISNSHEILVPTSAVYHSDGHFMGYTMEMAKGTSCVIHDSRLTVSQKEDLYMYAKDHSRIEAVLQKNPSIVFPDVCTLSNLFFDDDGNISLIDYDGLQVGKYGSFSISSFLDDPNQYYYHSKYCKNGYYTKELDKKSSIILYFLRTFRVKLNAVGQVIPGTNRIATLDDVFHLIHLDDPDLCHKVWKVFQDDQPNDFLGDTVYRIADKYDLHAIDDSGKHCMKVLTRKR